MSDKLSKYGHGFQIKVVTSLMTDKSFMQQVIDILSPKFFESEANQWLVQTIFDYFTQYSESPTLEAMKVEIDKAKLPDVLQATVVEHLKQATTHIGATDLQYVKDETIDFCKNQVLKQAIMDSVQLLNDGEYDAIKTKIDGAMKAGADRDIGHIFTKNVRERYTEAVRKNKLEMPWDAINNLCDGGFGKGELIVLAAPSGIGKSWGLINIGAHALKIGKTVAHYSLELDEGYVGLRYDAVLTGIANQNLKYNIEDVEKKVEGLDGELILKYWPTKTKSVNAIRAHIDKCILQDMKPDCIIVDYADLLKGASTRNNLRTDEILGDIYGDLRGLAGEYEIPVFTASQTQRSALEEDVIGADKIAASYEKIMIADFVISLSRKVTDKLAGTGRWHIVKNRFGPDGMTLPSKMNLSNGQINIYEESSVQGQDAKAKMNNGEEYQRKALAQKFAELKSGGGAFG